MYFQHSCEIWRDFPDLVAGVVFVEGITGDLPVARPVMELGAVAAGRLGVGTEADLVAVQAWRRAFSRMGLKPTQYRSAAEALLRRYRMKGFLPQLHPLVDLCNAASIAYAIPVAVFDIAKVTGNLQVRYATGQEDYLAFTGAAEHPEPGEVIYADDGGHAHARRWTNRQSATSAVTGATSAALIVVEALHDTAAVDVRVLQDALVCALQAGLPSPPVTGVLTGSAARFSCPAHSD